MEKLGPFELGKVHCVDCVEAMKLLPDKCVDAVVTDPPYGIGMDGGNVGYKGNNDLAKKDWDSAPMSQAAQCEIMRVSESQILWGGNYFELPPSRGWLVWDKGAGFAGRTYAEAELAWTSLDVNVRIFRRDPLARRDYVGKVHPTQKPILLMKWCIDKTSGIVLDPFSGSGTTGVACVQTGRRFLGFEIDPEYCRIANERIQAARKGVTLKEHRTGQESLFS